ncbi:hypothetical protein ACCT09_42835, partial [Rhizobium ruizarguesonis]
EWPLKRCTLITSRIKTERGSVEEKNNELDPFRQAFHRRRVDCRNDDISVRAGADHSHMPALGVGQGLKLRQRRVHRLDQAR